MSKEKKTKENYASAIKELQQIVEDMQAEQISIDDMAAKARRAAELIAFCRQQLRTTETEIGGLFGEG